MIASKGVHLDLVGGTGDCETSLDKCAWDACCRTFFSERFDAMPAPLIAGRSRRAPIHRVDSRRFGGRGTGFRWLPRGRAAAWRTLHPETAQPDIARSLPERWHPLGSAPRQTRRG